MKEWMTEERVCDVLRQCEQNGINTWQFSYQERGVTDLKRHRAEGGKVIVEFDHADGGLRIGRKDMLDPPKLRASGELPNVELAGENTRWRKATAKLDGERLAAWSAEVPKPLHVRYCYANIPDPPFLYNAAGLPAAAFTTLEQ